MKSSWSSTAFEKPTDFDTWDRCITRGLPPSMFPFNYNNGIEIHQAPGYVIVRLEMVHEARIIPVDGRAQLDPAIKHWMGESRGHFEGNTLVVETTNFNGLGGMTNVGIPGSPFGDTPTTTNMKITERFTRTDADTIQYEMHVEDPEVITQPWTARYPMQRDDTINSSSSRATRTTRRFATSSSRRATSARKRRKNNDNLSHAAGRAGFLASAGLLFCGAASAQLKEPIKLDAGRSATRRSRRRAFARSKASRSRLRRRRAAMGCAAARREMGRRTRASKFGNVSFSPPADRGPSAASTSRCCRTRRRSPRTACI